MKNLSFCRDWLPLDKKDFRILAMLADKGEFRGNLSDLCRYFSVDPQQRNRNQLREAIQRLSDQGLIACEISGRTYTLRAIPKGKEIEIPREWFSLLLHHQYSAESVSWEAVMKVLLWLVDCDDQVITNNKVAADLNVSVSTVVSAKNVLEKDFSAITKTYVSEKIDEDFFVRLGQQIDVSAWWASD